MGSRSRLCAGEGQANKSNIWQNFGISTVLMYGRTRPCDWMGNKSALQRGSMKGYFQPITVCVNPDGDFGPRNFASPDNAQPMYVFLTDGLLTTPAS